MSKGAFFGVSNAAKKVKRAYIGVNGQPRRIKRIYFGVNNAPKLVWSGAFAYSFKADNGRTDQCILTGQLDGDWCLTFLSSGTLTVTELGTATDGIDIFAVAGGENGKSGSVNVWGDQHTTVVEHYGGHGGRGGTASTARAKTITVTSYKVVVGGVGKASSFGSLLTATGYGKEGGYGGLEKVGDVFHQAGNGSDGSYAFGDSKQATHWNAGTIFGSSGGGGFGSYNGSSYGYGKGGSGAGAGGADIMKNGGNATTPGSGGGGAGGSIKGSNGVVTNYSGGIAQGGVVMIRNKR